MTERIKLTEKDFMYSDASDMLILDMTVDMNITGKEFYDNIIQQILENQEKAKRLDSVLGSPYKITYHGASKYTSVAVLNKEHLRQLLEKEKKYDLEFTNGKGVELGLLEQENKQLKEIKKRYNLRLHRIITLEKHNKELVDELAESLQKLEKIGDKLDLKIYTIQKQINNLHRPLGAVYELWKEKLKEMKELKEILESKS